MFNLKKPAPKRKETNSRLIGVFVGDFVRVCSDESKVKELQVGRGGYSQQRMQCVLGQRVKIKHIAPDCVKVSWETREFDLHPDAIEIISQHPSASNHSDEIIKDDAVSLFTAIDQGNIEQFCALINTNLLNKQNNHGRTPINAACAAGNLDIVELLLELDANLNIPDHNGNLAIHTCAWHHHTNFLKSILNKDPQQINLLNGEGRSLLHIAVIEGDQELETYLLISHINIHTEDNFGKTAYQYQSNFQNLNKTRNDLDIFSLMQLSLSSVNASSQITNYNNRLFTAKPLNRSEAYQLYCDVSLAEPPRELESLQSSINFKYQQPRSSSDESERNVYERHLNNSIFGPIRKSYDYSTIIPPSVGPLQQSMSLNSSSQSGQQSNEIKPNECEICRSRAKKIAFVECGHTSCSECAKKLFQCHMCKKEIIDKLVIYM